MPTIFLVHRTHLLYQTAEKHIETMPEVKPYLGIVGDGSKELKYIRLATVQTIDSMLKTYGERFAKELEMFNLLIVDECHRATGDQLQKVLTALPNCDYRLGLSATQFMTGKEVDDLTLKGCLTVWSTASPPAISYGPACWPGRISAFTPLISRMTQSSASSGTIGISIRD